MTKTPALNLDQLIGAAYVTSNFSTLTDTILLDCICRIETLGENMPQDMLVNFQGEADKRGLRGELDLADVGGEAEDDDSQYEEFVSAGLIDTKGREVGFIVGVKDVEGTTYAWVQNARRTNGTAKDFGTLQRSRPFPTPAAAKAWANRTARERIANLK